MKPSALILSAEPSIVAASRSALEDSWELQSASNKTEACTQLEQAHYDLLLIDQQHSQNEEISDLFPGAADPLRPTTPRIQFTEVNSSGELKVHFSHPRVVSDDSQAPPQPESFQEQIDHELLRQTLFGKPGLNAILEKIQKTPSRPGVYFRVVEELTNPEGTIDRVAELVKEDPLVTARILRAVNSTALGLRRRLTDANEAVMMLGGERVRDVILLSEVLSVIDQNRCIGFNPDEVWDHSFHVGQLARKIMSTASRCQSTRDAAFTAGLLHDVGKVLLAVNVPGRYAKALLMAKKNKTTLVEEEEREFQTNHADLGTHLLESWDLPTRILEAIMWHHTPEKYASPELTPAASLVIANTLIQPTTKAPHDEEEQGTTSPIEHIESIWGKSKLADWQALLDE